MIEVNTTRPSRHIDREVSATQIQLVAQRLPHATREQLRIVVTHQPVHVTRPAEEKNVLHGHREAVRERADAGADLLMGGHIHLPYVRPLTERFTDVLRSAWVVQAGTAVSTRVRYDAPNSLKEVLMGGTAFSHNGRMMEQNGYTITTVRGRNHEELYKRESVMIRGLTTTRENLRP